LKNKFKIYKKSSIGQNQYNIEQRTEKKNGILLRNSLRGIAAVGTSANIHATSNPGIDVAEIKENDE
jgi:hypothetical protein